MTTTETESRITKNALEIGTAILSLKEPNIEQMSKELSKMFIMVSLADRKKLPIPDELKGTFGYKVLTSRAEVHKVDLDPYVTVFMTLLANSPGTLILYLATLHALNKLLGHTATFNDMVNAFPMGFPTDAALSNVWDTQKVTLRQRKASESDNSLDYPEAWVK